MDTPNCALRIAAMALSLVIAGGTVATAQDTKKKTQPDFKEEGKKLFDKNKPAGQPGKEGGTSAGWSVAVFTFRGDERAKESRSVLQYVRTTGRLPEARMEERGQSVVILVASFEDPQSPEARAELERVRAVKVDDKLPYASAFLAPPVNGVGEGRRPEINLLRVKEQQPAALYSFQVAVYGRDDIKDRPITEDDLRDARHGAEQAALQLRAEGEEAYYYHGPRMSMVTIGVFDITDFDSQMPQFESDRLKAVRKRHPLNLYNGKAIKVTVPGKGEQLQTSSLVNIPKK